MKETIKILAMVAIVLLIILIFMAAEVWGDSEPIAEPVAINLEASDEEAEASLKELSDGHVLNLSAEERDLVERVVAAEARGESLECMMACAQTIRDRCLEWDKPVTEICLSPNQFCKAYNGEISDRVKDAVEFTFIHGIDTVSYPVTHFYASHLIEPPHWTVDKTKLAEIDGVSFYY